MSVVIPTIGRPELSRAVESVLAQTTPVHEIIVAADTTDELDIPADDRVRVIRVGPGAGGNAGRQSGVEQRRVTSSVCGRRRRVGPDQGSVLTELVADATGPWIATSRTRMKRADGTELIQPSFPIAAGEDVRTYMFAKRTPRSGHGFIQASTLLFPRTLALDVPFDVDLKFHQDVSWLTSVAARHPDLRVFQAWEPLASYYATEGSVSKRIAPQGSIAWARRFLSDDPRLLGDFILTQSLGFARRSGSPGAMVRTLWAGVRLGRPGAAASVLRDRGHGQALSSTKETPECDAYTFEGPARRDKHRRRDPPACVLRRALPCRTAPHPPGRSERRLHRLVAAARLGRRLPRRRHVETLRVSVRSPRTDVVGGQAR